MKTKLISTLMTLMFIFTLAPSAMADSAGYTKASYKTERIDRSIKDASGNVLFEYWYDKIVLTDDNENAKKINEQINADCEKFFTEYSDMDTTYMNPQNKFYSTMKSEVTQSDNGILSISLTGDYYVGQHPSLIIPKESAMSFNLRTGEKLKLSDVLSMSETEAKTYVKS